MRLKEEFDKYMKIEEEFFDVDRETRVATVRIAFGSPEDIFDVNYVTKAPVFSDEFSDWIKSAFRLVPNKYKIRLEIVFDDMAGYTDEQLLDLFKKNLYLDFKSTSEVGRAKNRIACGLIGIGTALFVAMILINNLWTGESLFKSIFAYVSDIAATVTFWEAMNILIVENMETRRHMSNLAGRFESIRFLSSAEESVERGEA